MAIKKPITKLQPKTPPPAPSKLKKRPVPVEVDEAEVEDEDEDEEETPKDRKVRLAIAAELAKRAAKKKPAPVEDEDENEADVEEEEVEDEDDEAEAEADDEDEAPAPRKGSKKKKKEKRSLADVFDSTKPGRGLMPAGDFKMKVTGYELEGEIAGEDEEQGLLKVKVTYEGAEDEEEGVAGKTISQWYQIADDEGQPGPGIPFLKGDLDILGYEDITLADLEEVFEDVSADEPLVIIKVKQNGQYTNAYLQGLAEEE